MANWCQTEVELHCCDEMAAKKVYQTILDCEKKNDTVGLWEYDLITLTGHNIDDFSVCRGDIIEYSIEGKIVYIYADEAWSPNMHFWQQFCEAEFYNEVEEIFYTAEEPGCEIYETNDVKKVGSYVIDIVDVDVEYFAAEEHTEVVKLLCDLLIEKGPKDDPDFNVNEIISISKEDSRFIDEMSLAELTAKYDLAYVHQFEYCSIEDCC